MQGHLPKIYLETATSGITCHIAQGRKQLIGIKI